MIDFKRDSKMDAKVGILYAMVEGNYERLCSIVEGVSQDELDYKGIKKNGNSIAQLIRHLTDVDLSWVYRIKREAIPAELEEKFGPMLDSTNQLPAIINIPLQDLLTDYDQISAMLKNICCQLTDEEIEQSVDYEGGKQATIQWGIWHIADHSRYHQAHINLVRKTWYMK